MLILRETILRKKILSIAVPAMAEMVLYMLVGVVDIAVVGRLGATPLAAVGLGAEIFFSVLLFLQSLGMGSSVLAAQAKGAGKMNYVQRIAGQTFLISLVMGLAVSCLGLYYNESLLGLFAVEKAVYNQALAYLEIVFWIAPIALPFYMISSVFRGLGRTDIPMKIALVVNLINTLGDFVLVFGMAGFPALGVVGAAWATSLAHAAGFLLAVYALLSKWGGLDINITSLFPVDLKTVKDIVFLGLPSLTEEFFHTSTNLISMFLIAFLGTLSFAAHEIAITVESLSFMPGFGIAVTATSIVGQAVGANNKVDALKGTQACMELGALLMGSLGILFAIFPYHIARLFTTDQNLIYLAGLLIRIASLEQITIALGMILGGVLKGSGDTRTPMTISIIFTWLYRLPFMYLIICIWHLPISYIWLVFASDWLGRALVYLVIIARGKWLITKSRV